MTDVTKDVSSPIDVITDDQQTIDSTDDDSQVSVDVIVDEVFVDVVADQSSDVDVFVEGQGLVDVTSGSDIIVEADAYGGLHGPAGPPGPSGPSGPPGPPGEGLDIDSLAYRHIQTVASVTWIINHPLQFRPNVSVTDSSGQEIWPGELLYLSSSTIQLTFSSSVGGEAYLT